MPKTTMSFLPSTRIDPALRDEFLREAKNNHQTTSEAVREAITAYIRRAKEHRIREQAIRIRADTEEEEDVMRFIAENSVAFDDDN